uniref:RNase H type-1 domain-containing protein n=1 Tax=Chenopodium quinoa TaxID=63459 RepID=A0A803MSD5_CHEQI
MKRKLATPPVLIPLKQNGKPLMLYLSATKDSIASMLTQENEEGHEQAIFYLSRTLHDNETRYTNVEKWCLSLNDASIKLNHYFMDFLVEIISPTAKAVKGQALVKFLADHPPMENVMVQEEKSWTMFFNGSSRRKLAGAWTLKDMGVTKVKLLGDSQWEIAQVNKEYKGISPLAMTFSSIVQELINAFEFIQVSHIQREENREANFLAQQASSLLDFKGFDE